jgi:hypothetical protein
MINKNIQKRVYSYKLHLKKSAEKQIFFIVFTEMLFNIKKISIEMTKRNAKLGFNVSSRNISKHAKVLYLIDRHFRETAFFLMQVK